VLYLEIHHAVYAFHFAWPFEGIVLPVLNALDFNSFELEPVFMFSFFYDFLELDCINLGFVPVSLPSHNTEVEFAFGYLFDVHGFPAERVAMIEFFEPLQRLECGGLFIFKGNGVNGNLLLRKASSLFEDVVGRLHGWKW
jgi:hypothetical protein